MFLLLGFVRVIKLKIIIIDESEIIKNEYQLPLKQKSNMLIQERDYNSNPGTKENILNFVVVVWVARVTKLMTELTKSYWMAKTKISQL